MAKPKLITPVGIVKFPFIERADSRGKYSIALTFDPKDKEYLSLLDQIAKAENDFEKKYRGKPHSKKDFKIEDGEKKESGLMLMQFKSAFPIFDDKDSKIFDCKNNKIKTDIGWGSKCRVAFVLSPYDQDGNVGVTRYIYGIQIVELKSSGTTAENCGFDEQEGYVAPAAKPDMTPEEREKAIAKDEIAWDE